MSVLIKGMEMPKIDSWVNVRIKEKDGKPIIAFITGEDLEGKYFEIEEVPTPHGRLVDAEELSKVFDWKQLENSPDEKEQTLYSLGQTTIEAIREAPTIIEAEVSEE